MQRDSGIDHVRILLTGLVVLHHIAIVYGGAGDWYWIEATERKTHLIAFNTVNQSFFMGLFFLISGYFSHASIERKGPAQFLVDRLIRLGIPLTVYFLLISPLTVALASTDGYQSLLPDVAQLMGALEFEPGPMWFVMALLLFSLPLTALYAWKPHTRLSLRTLPSRPAMAGSLLLIASFTFFVRLLAPVGETYLWLQLGYFPLYVILFVLGVYAYPNRLLHTLTVQSVKDWLPLSLALVAALPALLHLAPDQDAFAGGANLYALTYAVWEPFTATGIIIGLLYLLVVRLNRPNRLSRLLSPLMYCTFIIHPPILVGVSRLLAAAGLQYPTNLLANAGLTLCLCVLASWLILRIPYVARIL